MAKLRLNSDLLKKIVDLIKVGNYAKTACLASGITEDTYYRWLKTGQEDIKNDKETIFSEFSESIMRARAEAEARNVMTIQKASQTDWKAASWWLERTNNQEWGRRQDITVKTEKIDELLDSIRSM